MFGRDLHTDEPVRDLTDEELAFVFEQHAFKTHKTPDSTMNYYQRQRACSHRVVNHVTVHGFGLRYTTCHLCGAKIKPPT